MIDVIVGAWAIVTGAIGLGVSVWGLSTYSDKRTAWGLGFMVTSVAAFIFCIAFARS